MKFGSILLLIFLSPFSCFADTLIPYENKQSWISDLFDPEAFLFEFKEEQRTYTLQIEPINDQLRLYGAKYNTIIGFKISQLFQEDKVYSLEEVQQLLKKKWPYTFKKNQLIHISERENIQIKHLLLHAAFILYFEKTKLLGVGQTSL